jgi:hypothetical protein
MSVNIKHRREDNMKRACSEEDQYSLKRYRPKDAATRFPSDSTLDAATLANLAKAALPGYKVPVRDLAIIDIMLQKTTSEARRRLEAIAKPSRDSVIFSWCLEYETDGDDQFVEEYYNLPEWLYQIDLNKVSIPYLQSTVDPAWLTNDSDQTDWYPRKRAMRVLATVWSAKSELYEGHDVDFWPAVCAQYWPRFVPSWDTIELVRAALAAELNRLKETHIDE